MHATDSANSDNLSLAIGPETGLSSIQVLDSEERDRQCGIDPICQSQSGQVNEGNQITK